MRIKNKGSRQAVGSTGTVDEIIERAMQPTMVKNTSAKIYKNKVLAKGKIHYSNYYGLTNPAKLNISTDTLSKIKK